MSKKKSAQKKLINELRKQLFTQAERLGVRDQYTPIVLEELNLDAVKKILTEFYMERSNIEYELSMMGSNKRESLIKLERLNVYIRKAEAMVERQDKKIEKLLDGNVGDQKTTLWALKKRYKSQDKKRIQAAV
ncbi:MAG: hypothetical protein ABIH69_04915 [bacterium]